VEKPADDEALELGETEDDYFIMAIEPDEMDISEDNTNSDPKYDSTEENPSDTSVSDAEFNFEIKPIKPGSRRVGVRKKRVEIKYSKPVATAECDICQKKFIGRHAEDILKRHLKIHTSGRPLRKRLSPYEKPEPVICPICQMEFPAGKYAKEKLKRHAKTHNVVNPSSRVGHRRKAAKKEKPHVLACHICDKRFEGRRAMPSTLKKHMETHNEERERKFPCTHCPQRFFGRREQQSHLKRIHLRIKPFACKVCGKTFATGSERNIHENVFNIGNSSDFVN
jgi:transcription elongation factor Elf1